MYGEQFGALVVPTHWTSDAAAQHGDRPQASLNNQLVNSADIVIALFWHRLGTNTGEALSGTVEEIEEAADGGAYVGILRCTRAFPHDVDTAQIESLRDFYSSIVDRSLVLPYADEPDLARHTEQIVLWAVTRNSTRAQAAADTASIGAEVWPRVESEEKTKTDSKGRIKTRTHWRLVLSNTGTEPARNVRYRLDPEEEGDALPRDLSGDRDLEALPPGGEARYTLALHMGVASQARCVVEWEDSTGAHENVATVRFF